MIKKPDSTIFLAVLDNEQLFNNLDHIKLNDYNRFLKVGETGKQIQSLAKDDDVAGLEEICQKNRFDVPFMKIEIEDAFVSALNLRNEQVVEYFLKNGLNLDNVAPQCILTICYSLEYLTHDPPIDLLKICLEYGGNPRVANSQQADTAMHIAARSGQVGFLELLLEYGADINAANDDGMTPLGCALKSKRVQAINFLKSKNASQKWN